MDCCEYGLLARDIQALDADLALAPFTDCCLDGYEVDQHADCSMMLMGQSVGFTQVKAGSGEAAEQDFPEELFGDTRTAQRSVSALELEWPCLNVTHLQPCYRCTAAPLGEQAPDFALVGDAGKRNGAKKLRSLLAATGMWKSMEHRCSAAAAANAAGLTRLVEALNGRRSNSLSKEEIFFLARHWKVRSDIWQPRKSNGADRAVAAAAAAAAAAAVGAPPATSRSAAFGNNTHASHSLMMTRDAAAGAAVTPTFLRAVEPHPQLSDVTHNILRRMRDLSQQLLPGMAGARAHATCVQYNAGAMCAAALMDMRQVMILVQDIPGAIAKVHLGLVFHLSQVSGNTALRERPAAELLRAADAGHEEVLRRLMGLNRVITGDMSRAAVAKALQVPESVWVGELIESHELEHTLLLMGLQALGQLRERASLRDYLEASVAVIEGIVSYNTTKLAAGHHRFSWVQKVAERSMGPPEISGSGLSGSTAAPHGIMFEYASGPSAACPTPEPVECAAAEGEQRLLPRRAAAPASSAGTAGGGGGGYGSGSGCGGGGSDSGGPAMSGQSLSLLPSITHMWQVAELAREFMQQQPSVLSVGMPAS